MLFWSATGRLPFARTIHWQQYTSWSVTLLPPCETSPSVSPIDMQYLHHHGNPARCFGGILLIYVWRRCMCTRRCQSTRRGWSMGAAVWLRLGQGQKDPKHRVVVASRGHQCRLADTRRWFVAAKSRSAGPSLSLQSPRVQVRAIRFCCCKSLCVGPSLSLQSPRVQVRAGPSLSLQSPRVQVRLCRCKVPVCRSVFVAAKSPCAGAFTTFLSLQVPVCMSMHYVFVAAKSPCAGPFLSLQSPRVQVRAIRFCCCKVPVCRSVQYLFVAAKSPCRSVFVAIKSVCASPCNTFLSLQSLRV